MRHLKWTDALNAKIKKATRYPIILGIAVFGAGMFMMMFVVPQVVEMLKMIGQELPTATLALIATSNAVQDYWYLILSLPVAAYLLFKLARRTSEAAMKPRSYNRADCSSSCVTVARTSLASCGELSHQPDAPLGGAELDLSLDDVAALGNAGLSGRGGEGEAAFRGFELRFCVDQSIDQEQHRLGLTIRGRALARGERSRGRPRILGSRRAGLRRFLGQ